MVDQGFYCDNNNTFLRTVSSQSEYDKTVFILQNMNYLIINPRDLVLSDKVLQYKRTHCFCQNLMTSL